MTKYKVLGLVLLLCVSFLGFTQEQATITVLPFQSIEVSASVSMIITTLFETNLVNTNAYIVLSQNERDQILAAQEASISDCSDEACAIEIGKLLSAELIIMGTVAALGTKYIINAKIIDVTTSKTIGADSISASSVEELDIACKNLTLALVQRAQPKVMLAAKPEEPEPEPEVVEEKPEAVAETEPEKEPVAEAKPEPIKEKPPKTRVKVARVPGGFDVVSYATLTAGLLLTQIGNVTEGIGFELKQQASESWDNYISAGENLDALYDDYSSAQSTYTVFGISSYSLWGLGAGAVPVSLFVLPGHTLGLSTLGKISFSAGVAFSVAGNLLALMAGNQQIDNISLWDNYISAGENLDALYDSYSSGYTTYSLFRILSYSLWGLSAAGLAGSFFLPGEKEALAPTLLDRILITAGMTLISIGNVTRSMALNSRAIMEERWNDYINAGENLDALYDDYNGAFTQYSIFTFLSYGLWAGGAAAVISSLFIPFGSAPAVVKEERPVKLRLIPAVSGFNIQLEFNPKGKNR